VVDFLDERFGGCGEGFEPCGEHADFLDALACGLSVGTHASWDDGVRTGEEECGAGT
jgi:hypothetical protein